MKVFEPIDGQEMRVAYPELNGYEEFDPLSDQDLRFVWNHSCQSSDISRLPEPQRTLQALEVSYGKTYIQNPTAVKIAKAQIPDDIVLAINRMKRFVPGARVRGNKMIHKIFDNLEALIQLDKDVISTMMPAERKQYVGVAVDVSNALPGIIAQMEIGFSVSKKGGKNDISDSKEDGSDLMDETISSSEQ